MQRQSLSDFPIEILENIVCYLGNDMETLHRILRVNKAIGSRAVTFLYTVLWHSARFPLLLKTLYRSLRGGSYFPYHRHITKLSTYGWLDAIDLFKANTQGRLHELFDVVLQSGKLEHLELSVDNLLEDLDVDIPVDYTALTSLALRFREGPRPGILTRTWLQTMVPRMPLQNLGIDIGIGHWDQSWPDFPISIKSLATLDVQGRGGVEDPCLRTKFWHTFLIPNWNTLTSLTLSDIKMTLNYRVKLPQLQTLTIARCQLEGWANLCRALTALKHLLLFDVNILQVTTENILSFLPSGVIKSLESLDIACVSKSNRLPSPWLDTVATSLSSLVILKVDAICVDTLRNVLTHCPNPEEYFHLPFGDRHSTGPTNEHLQVLSKFTPVSLKVLALHLGNFDSLDLAGFAEIFPASVKSLDLSCSRSLTALNLRGLFQLPLSEFIMRGTYIQPEHQSKMELILQTERPVMLQRFIWNFDVSYSFYRDLTREGKLQYSAWDD